MVLDKSWLKVEGKKDTDGLWRENSKIASINFIDYNNLEISLNLEDTLSPAEKVEVSTRLHGHIMGVHPFHDFKINVTVGGIHAPDWWTKHITPKEVIGDYEEMDWGINLL